MSIKSLLMPAITQWFLSRESLQKRRIKAERQRRASSAPHEVHYFHQVDDPYSALTASCLPALAERYDIRISAHVVGAPPDNAAPERDKLIAYSRKDAQLLARRFDLEFHDTGAQPPPQDINTATRLLVAAVQAGRFVDVAGKISSNLWKGLPALVEIPEVEEVAAMADTFSEADTTATQAHLAASTTLRQRLGHYLGATFFYGGEWYWGIDRLHFLEERLQELGAKRDPSEAPLFPPSQDLKTPVHLGHPPPIDFFVSLRSPYSAIVAPRVFELGRLTGAQVRLRYVLPMVMRGLPVPKEKRLYISQDAAREAFARGTPFGRLNDPVGRPTERGLALIPFAEKQGRGQAYLLSFMHGVWAEGMDAGSDRGLRNIVERAGLGWEGARSALLNDAWRKTAELNREEMFSLGLWGVPSFHVGDTVVWGQDRLWAVEDELLKGKI